jgi:hypothetical protein
MQMKIKIARILAVEDGQHFDPWGRAGLNDAVLLYFNICGSAFKGIGFQVSVSYGAIS